MDELKLLVERQENCRASLVENRLVTRQYEEDTLTRHIHTYKLEGHPTAKRIYVWQSERSVGEREIEYVTILGIPPINSPEAALDSHRARIRAQFFQSL